MADNTSSTPTPTPAPVWGNPTPAGLVALAAACFGFFALLTGQVGANAMPLLGAWLIGGALIQTVVALVDLKGGNQVGGSTFLYFTGFFMLASGIEQFVKYSAITEGAPLDGRIDGWFWLAITIVVWLWLPAFYAKGVTLLALIVTVIGVAAPFLVCADLNILFAPATSKAIAGWALLVAGVGGIYLGAAQIVNGAFGKKVYPVL
ncbi:MAG: GPR1/FUN34/YaaH family transporter [Propionibacteriaceae bacterium]|jgi:succinate-acetate transporter protein|nr:GPR1/FUN34/YaaH family transporter [Propionibacteriaceae bacterium]